MFDFGRLGKGRSWARSALDGGWNPMLSRPSKAVAKPGAPPAYPFNPDSPLGRTVSPHLHRRLSMETYVGIAVSKNKLGVKEVDQTESGSSPSCAMISAVSTWSRKPCSLSTTHSAQGCRLRLREDARKLAVTRRCEEIASLLGAAHGNPTAAETDAPTSASTCLRLVDGDGR